MTALERKVNGMVSLSLAAGGVIVKNKADFKNTNEYSSFLNVANLTRGTIKGIKNRSTHQNIFFNKLKKINF